MKSWYLITIDLENTIKVLIFHIFKITWATLIDSLETLKDSRCTVKTTAIHYSQSVQLLTHVCWNWMLSSSLTTSCPITIHRRFVWIRFRNVELFKWNALAKYRLTATVINEVTIFGHVHLFGSNSTHYSQITTYYQYYSICFVWHYQGSYYFCSGAGLMEGCQLFIVVTSSLRETNFALRQSLCRECLWSDQQDLSVLLEWSGFLLLYLLTSSSFKLWNIYITFF